MDNTLELHSLRRDYTLNSLDEAIVSSNPFEQFQRWFSEAQASGVLEPNAMTLATATSSGIPSARVVLLKGMDEHGFMFATNYESRKGEELLANPYAALLFFWGDMQRQIRIEGTVEKVSKEESDNYFKSRPRESRIGAWASKQSKKVEGREQLEEEYSAMTMKFENQEIPLPEFWGGFRVVPVMFEFWQGRANRLHDRICYRLIDDIWEIERLYP
ncbi:MAG: pyridoxamine 5'-phosphate oxidase [Ignavibacteriae bacterium]|nr:pyridoxamine 5'-phosphate oxidase [Ignavibacteriota bacterium]